MLKKRQIGIWTALGVILLVVAACSSQKKDTSKTTAVVKNSPKVALMYTLDPKFDHSFNESAYHGLVKFKAEFPKIKIFEYNPKSVDALSQMYNRLLNNDYSFIIGVGDVNGSSIKESATRYPDRSFAIIDVSVRKNNVTSILFDDHEGAFLVGMIAALKTKSNVVSAIAGMGVPPVKNMFCGFKEGVNYISKLQNKHIKILYNVVSSTASGFSNPGKGAEIAISQFNQKSDVVFAIAGLTSVGILKAANQKGKYAIGVDSNQDGLYPGTVLTSLIKNIGGEVEGLLSAYFAGDLEAGIFHVGLKDNAVRWTLDQYNKDLITQDIKNIVNKARLDIISGKLHVTSYYENPNCINTN